MRVLLSIRNRENDYISRTKKISIFIWKKVNSSQLCVLFIPVRIHAGCWENARKVCKTTSLRQVTYEVSLSKFSNLKERPCSHLITDIKSRKRKVKKPRQCFDNSQKLMPQHNHSKTKNQTKKNAMTHLIQTIFFSQDDKIKFQPLDKGNNNHNNDYTF